VLKELMGNVARGIHIGLIIGGLCIFWLELSNVLIRIYCDLWHT
jgi:hypothetical protein